MWFLCFRVCHIGTIKVLARVGGGVLSESCWKNFSSSRVVGLRVCFQLVVGQRLLLSPCHHVGPTIWQLGSSNPIRERVCQQQRNHNFMYPNDRCDISLPCIGCKQVSRLTDIQGEGEAYTEPEYQEAVVIETVLEFACHRDSFLLFLMVKEF